MSLTPTKSWDLLRATQAYAIDRWGAPYFSINYRGDIVVSPRQEQGASLTLPKVVSVAQERGLTFPLVLRFQDLLRDRVVILNETFRTVIKEANYQGNYTGVFPIKVNQLREVVEEILDAGAPYHFGLEAGSKPELAAAVAIHRDPESLIVCNGYKDETFIRTAMIGRKLGKKVILVVEKLDELPMILDIAKAMGAEPMIGFRVRLRAKSAGKWAMSSGENAKFGLSASELVEAMDMLSANGFSQAFKLVHFHIGSQIPDIQVLKQAVREAARYYAKARQLGFPVDYVDVGGGLGVDYDGSRSTSDSSTNYTLEEYCADVVYNVAEICDAEKVPHPNIVSESGRALVCHHSVLIVEAFGSSEKTKAHRVPPPPMPNEHAMVHNMAALLSGINKRNRRESLHDAQQLREQADLMFEMGLLDLRSKARLEDIYWEVAERVADLFQGTRLLPQEIQDLQMLLSDQYICNFSVFQSLLDHWAVGQVFPVMPIERLLEPPSNRGTLVDITCDSDGKVKTFIESEGLSSTLQLHPFDGKPYRLAFFLVGAYQDVMGDIHNLFGRVNEAHVFLDPDEEDGFYIEEIIEGATIADVLADVQYDLHELTSEMKAQVDAAIKADVLKPKEGMRLLEEYEKSLKTPTYLRIAPRANGVGENPVPVDPKH
jgi:arginine decarboxylase